MPHPTARLSGARIWSFERNASSPSSITAESGPSGRDIDLKSGRDDISEKLTAAFSGRLDAQL
jgi:hypothetical protein